MTETQTIGGAEKMSPHKTDHIKKIGLELHIQTYFMPPYQAYFEDQ